MLSPLRLNALRAASIPRFDSLIPSPKCCIDPIGIARPGCNSSPPDKLPLDVMNCRGACTVLAVRYWGRVHSEGSDGPAVVAAAAAETVGTLDPAETGSIQNAPPAPLLVGATAHIAAAGRTLAGRIIPAAAAADASCCCCCGLCCCNRSPAWAVLIDLDPGGDDDGPAPS